MRLSTFEQTLDRLGPNVNNWEDSAAREQAQELLQSSETARVMLQNAQTVHDLVPKAMQVPFPQGLAQRILRTVSLSNNNPRTWQRICTNWILKPALAVIPLALGFLIGFSQADRSTIIEDEITTVHFEDYTNILFIAND